PLSSLTTPAPRSPLFPYTTLFRSENTLAARLPFALAGWLTLWCVYRLVWKATADRRAALSGAILTICSVQFLLFCRESRYYALRSEEHTSELQSLRHLVCRLLLEK